jgi:hypothetical protein
VAKLKAPQGFRKIDTEERRKQSIAETVAKSHAQHIRNLPEVQYKVLINAIREGAKAGVIAAYFGEQGWLTVSEKSFTQYINTFKRVYPELVENPPEAVEGMGDVVHMEFASTLDGVFPKNQTPLDPVAQLEQAIRAQSHRLRRGMEQERILGLANRELHKDFRAYKELLESLHDIKNGRGKAATVAVPVGHEAQEQLRSVEASEGTQDRLCNMLTDALRQIGGKKSSHVEA